MFKAISQNVSREQVETICSVNGMIGNISFLHKVENVVDENLERKTPF